MELENILLDIPEDISNMQLPNPGLLQIFQDIKERILWVDSEFTDGTLAFIKYIIYYNRLDKDIPVEERKPIKLFFASPGGDLDVKNALASVIDLSKTPVYGYAIGQVASAAAFTFLHCHKRFALDSSVFLFHKGSSMFGGNATDTLAFYDDYKQEINRLTKEITSYSTYTEEEVETNMKQDWYIRTPEALDHGIIDGVIDNIDILL